jgi:hypothetical protein
MTHPDSSLDVEDTTEMPPIGQRRVSDDDVTQIWRPRMQPEAPRRRRRARESSHHTVTKTRPAFRYLVGMPVVPGAAPDAPSLRAVAPGRARSRRGIRAWVGALAVITTSLAALLAFGSTAGSSASEGWVVVSAASTGGAPRMLQVFADGERRCTSVPCEVVLEPGEHFVSVVATGYEREPSRRVDIRAGEQASIHFDLLPRHD